MALWPACFQFFDVFGSFLAEPLVEQRQVLPLQVERQMKKIGVDRAAAAVSATVAMPDHVSIAIYAVIVGDFFTSPNVAEGQYMADSIDSSDEDIRVAGVVNVAFGNLHPNRLSAFQVIAMLFFAPGHGMFVIDYIRIVDRENNVSRRIVARCKHATAINPRLADNYRQNHRAI